jgi:hypothetical protein
VPAQKVEQAGVPACIEQGIRGWISPFLKYAIIAFDGASYTRVAKTSE